MKLVPPRGTGWGGTMPGVTATPPAAPPSARTTVKRRPDRGRYDRDQVHAVLDEGLVAHVGLATPEGPVVIPMLYARDGDRLLLRLDRQPAAAGRQGHRDVRHRHAGRRAGAGPVGFPPLDERYRSVVVFGQATAVADPDERRAALDVLVEHIVPGRTEETREPNDKELHGPPSSWRCRWTRPRSRSAPARPSTRTRTSTCRTGPAWCP